jgi:hypothetical protein
MANSICKYCKRSFENADAANKHYCDNMRKAEFLRTPKGRAAYTYYQSWLKLSRHSVVTSEETFLNSRYFSTFVKFIDYSNSMLLPSKSSFIKYMAEKKILPTFWCSDEIYINYIQNLDATYTPMQQADETVRTLHELADIFECKPDGVFEHLEAGDCIKLLRARRLTPWVLLFSKKFHNYLLFKLTAEQRLLLQTIIDPNLWKTKFKNRPMDVEKMKKFAEELNL